jgi:hypothetical protein
MIESRRNASGVCAVIPKILRAIFRRAPVGAALSRVQAFKLPAGAAIIQAQPACRATQRRLCRLMSAASAWVCLILPPDPFDESAERRGGLRWALPAGLRTSGGRETSESCERPIVGVSLSRDAAVVALSDVRK